jgi:hypothetical protein
MMYQNTLTSIDGLDGRHTKPEAVSKISRVQADSRPTTWLAEIEPLSILIHSVDNAWPASLYDRRMHCSIELPVDFDLNSARRSALVYAQEYMRAHVGETSWTLPQSVQWHEFVAIRSADDFQERKSNWTTNNSLSNSGVPAPSASKVRGRPHSIERPHTVGPGLFLALPEASKYSGLSMTLLKRKIRSGELAALKDRGWRVRRSDLEKI